MKYKPENDGIDHINVYSKGKTPLGRFLSNFAYTPINIPSHGKFVSIEGYWYWLGCTHSDKEIFRELTGYRAKQVGRELGAPDWIDAEQFKAYIRTAIYTKLNTYPEYLDKLKVSTVPLTHYYVYNGKVKNVPKAKWILDFLSSFMLTNQ